MSTPNKYLLARTLAGLTQEELAKKAHLSDKTILTLEKGGKMSRNTLEKIERVLGEELKKVESIK
jgi:DNA-binding XRE family transcriptional regulator